jgi:hypothetical protein
MKPTIIGIMQTIALETNSGDLQSDLIRHRIAPLVQKPCLEGILAPGRCMHDLEMVCWSESSKQNFGLD